MTGYEYQAVYSGFEPITPDPLIVERIRSAEQAMIVGINKSLYGDDDTPWVPRKPSLKERLQAFASRARDAWDVLLGRAEIGYD